ncbi:MAG: hypothetical protein ABEH78_01210 [Haloferacaceae archaeon]
MTQRTEGNGYCQCENCDKTWPETVLTAIRVAGCPACNSEQWTEVTSN